MICWVDSIQNNLSEIWTQTSSSKTTLVMGHNDEIDKHLPLADPSSADYDHYNIWNRLDSSFRNRVWMKVLGRNGRPDRASELLRQQLREGVDAPVPGIAAWNSVLDAWAEAAPTDETAVDEAYALLRLLQTDSRCQKAGVRPNVATYGCILKVGNSVVLCFLMFSPITSLTDGSALLSSALRWRATAVTSENRPRCSWTKWSNPKTCLFDPM